MGGCCAHHAGCRPRRCIGLRLKNALSLFARLHHAVCVSVLLCAPGLALVILSGGAMLLSPTLIGLITWKLKPFSIQPARISYDRGFLSRPFITSLSDGAILTRCNVAGNSPIPRLKIGVGGIDAGLFDR